LTELLAIHGPSLAIGAAISATAIIIVFYSIGGNLGGPVFNTADIIQSEVEKEQRQVLEEQSQTIGLSILFNNASPYLGDENAPITIIEFGDYQCFYCNKFFHETENQIYENYIKTGKAKMIFKDYIIIGQDSFVAAHAAHCASEQGKFWEYHDALYNNWSGENNGWASEENQYKFAKSVGLDDSKFAECMNSGKYGDLIESSTQDAQNLGIRGTPAFFIVGPNNKIVNIPGAHPYEVFANVLDSPELRN
jgi:protein-disulfide isomerase